jgi:pimeloyl-ACP methyl ester carboxylesterase
MPKTTMRDLVVILPGITGSVLTKSGVDLWAPSGEALLDYVFTNGRSLDALRLPPHDPNSPPEDDIFADRLVPDFHGVFGLGKIDGYSKLVNTIRSNFIFNRNNFISFPYDWRISNRVNARRLKMVIDENLDHLRIAEPETDVILIAHSMGGLVSRYYLEVLQGWCDCGAFITFGTPFRGSVNAVDYLANGYKNILMDLTNVMRTFPSVYELLPRYEMLKAGSVWQRVADTEKLPAGFTMPHGIDNKMTQDAFAFHLEIDAAVEANKQNPLWSDSRKRIYPVVGVRQKTLQSAELITGGKIVTGHGLPSKVDDAFDGGDGTVPRVSATPIELSDDHREIYFVEQHASLQNNEFVLNDLIERLRQMQGSGLSGILALDGDFGESGTMRPKIEQEDYSEQVDISGQPWIGLDFHDIYARDEQVQIHAQAIASHNSLAQGIEAVVQRVDTAGTGSLPVLYDFEASSSSDWLLCVNGLMPGRYKARVRTKVRNTDGPNDVTAIFEIADV